MSKLTLPWVDKLRELYEKYNSPDEILHHLYCYGVREEERLIKALEKARMEAEKWIPEEILFEDDMVYPIHHFKHEVEVEADEV